MATPAEKANLARIRDNQRRSRARRKEYIQELEHRIRDFERRGSQATEAMQRAARAVANENRRLRLLLNKHGVDDDKIDAFLVNRIVALPGDPGNPSFRSGAPGGAVQALERMLASGRKQSTGGGHASPALVVESNGMPYQLSGHHLGAGTPGATTVSTGCSPPDGRRSSDEEAAAAAAVAAASSLGMWDGATVVSTSPRSRSVVLPVMSTLGSNGGGGHHSLSAALAAGGSPQHFGGPRTPPISANGGGGPGSSATTAVGDVGDHHSNAGSETTGPTGDNRRQSTASSHHHQQHQQQAAAAAAAAAVAAYGYDVTRYNSHHHYADPSSHHHYVPTTTGGGGPNGIGSLASDLMASMAAAADGGHHHHHHHHGASHHQHDHLRDLRSPFGCIPVSAVDVVDSVSFGHSLSPYTPTSMHM